jgi:hypothetical protein
VSPSHGAAAVVSQKVPDVLLTPDVAVLERAVRERPDVAVAVLTQLRYGVAPPAGSHAGDGDGAAARVAGEPSSAGRHPDRR